MTVEERIIGIGVIQMGVKLTLKTVGFVRAANLAHKLFPRFFWNDSNILYLCTGANNKRWIVVVGCVN